MTISTTASRKDYTGDGIVVAFAFPYLFPTDADLDVYIYDTVSKINTLQTLTTHYTVTGENTATSGVVTMVTPPASTEELIIIRSVEQTQSSVYTDFNRLPSTSLEANLDRLTMLNQQLLEEINRKLGYDVNVEDFTGNLPEPLSNSLIGYDNTGQLENKILATTSGATFPALGLLASDGTNNFLGREIVVSGANVSISDPNGLAGDPTIQLSAMDNLISLNTTAADLVSVASGAGASLVGLEDSAGNTATITVEAAIEEIYAKIATTPKSMSLTRLNTTASGTQVVAHGFTGKIPSKFSSVSYNPTGFNSGGSGQCYTDGSTFVQACHHDQDSGAGGQHIQKDFLAQVMINAEADGQRLAVTAVDTTNVTFTWTKVGTPTAGTYEYEIGMI